MAGGNMKVAMIFEVMAGAATKALDMLMGKTKQLAALGRKGFANVTAGFGKIGRGLVTAGTLFVAKVGAMAGVVAKFMGPAREFENFLAVLKTTEGSAAKAKEALDWAETFAAKTPYDLKKVTEAYVQLRAYGLDPTNGLLRTLGDTAAAMNKPIMQAVEAIADAVTGENERLKEFGIKASAKGKYFLYSYTEDGVTKVAKALKTDRAAIEKVLTEIFNKKYGGAMEERSKTFDGLMSNIMDWWTKFQRMVMDSGPYEYVKGRFKDLLGFLDQSFADGTMQKFATGIGEAIINTFKTVEAVVRGAIPVFKTVASVLSKVADFVGGWENFATIVAATPFALIFANAALGVFQLAAGLAMIAASPVGLVLGAVAAAAYFLIDDWGAAFAWLGEKWDWVKTAAGAAFADLPALASAAFDWVGDVAASAATWIGNNWRSIADTAVGAFHTIGDVAQGAFAVIGDIAGSVWSTFSAGFDSYVSPIAERFSSLGTRFSSIGEKLSSIGSKIGTAFERIGAALGGPAGSSASKAVELLGRIAGFTFDKLIWALDLVAAGVEMVLSGLDQLLSWALTGKPIDWSAILPELPELPDFSNIKAEIAAFFAFDWLPDWSWPEIGLPELPKLDGVVAEIMSFFRGDWLPDWKWPEISEPNFQAAMSGITAPVENAYAIVAAVWDKIKALFDWSPIDTIMEKWGALEEKIGAMLNRVAETAGAAWKNLKSVFSDEAEIAISDPASVERAEAAAGRLAGHVQAIAAADTGRVVSAIAAAENKAGNIVMAVKSAIERSRAILNQTSFVAQGRKMMETLAAGIRQRAGAVVAEIRKVTQMVRDHLPSSPAKTGPLSDLHRLKFAETIAASIRPAPMVAAMQKATAATLAAAMITAPVATSPAVAGQRFGTPALAPSAGAPGGAAGAGGGVTVHAPISLTIHGGDTASIRDQVEAALQDHIRDLATALDREYARRGRRKH